MNTSFLFFVSLTNQQKKYLSSDDFRFEKFKRLLPSSSDYEKLDSYKHIDNKITFILNKLLRKKAIHSFIGNDEFQITTSSTGKPLVKDNINIKFNMSNCISENISTMIINNQSIEAGIDIADVNDHMGIDDSFDHTLYKDILSPIELELLSTQNSHNKIRLFALIWSV